MNPLCWYFGHRSEWVDDPCVRCGEPVGYEDIVGETPQGYTKEFLRYWLLRRWFPARCRECGKRYSNHNDCLPF